MFVALTVLAAGLLAAGGFYALTYGMGLLPRPRAAEPEHEGATEEYADVLEAMVVERNLDDTWGFSRINLEMRIIEESILDRVREECDLAIAMLMNDVWWKGARYAATTTV